MPPTVIPFLLTREQAAAVYERLFIKPEWRRRLLRLDPLHHFELLSLRDVYLPFWRVSVDTETKWTARIADYLSPERAHGLLSFLAVTTPRMIRGTRRDRHNDLFVPAYEAAGEGLTVFPFPADKAKPLTELALGSHERQQVTVTADEAMAPAHDLLRDEETTAIRLTLPGVSADKLALRVHASDWTAQLVYQPVWEVRYQYKRREYTMLLNGRTGDAHGEIAHVGINYKLLIAFLIFASLLAKIGYDLGAFSLLRGWP